MRKAVTNKGGLNGTTRFLWGGDSDWQCLEERDGDDDLVARFTYSPGYPPYGGPLAVQERDLNSDTDFTDTNEVVYHEQNTLFSVYALSDADGSVIERYRFDAYGGCTVLDADGSVDGDGLSDVRNPYVFTGRRLDLESGLMQYRHRYYSPVLGRFVSRDYAPWSDPWGAYAYVRARPGGFVDPEGLQPKTVKSGVIFDRQKPDYPGAQTFTTIVGWRVDEAPNVNGQPIWREGVHSTPVTRITSAILDYELVALHGYSGTHDEKNPSRGEATCVLDLAWGPDSECQNIRIVQLVNTGRLPWDIDDGDAVDGDNWKDEPIRRPRNDPHDPLLYPHQPCTQLPKGGWILRFRDTPGKPIGDWQELTQEFETCLICFDAGPECGVPLGCLKWSLKWTSGGGATWNLGIEPKGSKQGKPIWQGPSDDFWGLTDPLIQQRCRDLNSTVPRPGGPAIQ